MTIEFGLTDELTNTQYAPLAALLVHYQQNLILKPLAEVQIPVKTRDFSPYDKLVQVLFSQVRKLVPGDGVRPMTH